MNNYKWMAVSASKTTNWRNLQQTGHYDSAYEAKEAYFKEFPKSRACHLIASKEDQSGLMFHSLFGYPYIANVTKTTVIDKV